MEEQKTKEELIKEFKEILEKLIKQKKLKYYPFKRDLKYFDKKLLIDGVKLYKNKLMNVRGKNEK